jgi:hypothetical protein
VSEARRTVRATAGVFEDVDRLFPAERGPRREPSANDFEVFELLRIVETFATRFDDLSELIPGRPDHRVLIASGALAPRFMVVGQLGSDGAVELVHAVRSALCCYRLLPLALHCVDPMWTRPRRCDAVAFVTIVGVVGGAPPVSAMQ